MQLLTSLLPRTPVEAAMPGERYRGRQSSLLHLRPEAPYGWVRARLEGSRRESVTDTPPRRRREGRPVETDGQCVLEKPSYPAVRDHAATEAGNIAKENADRGGRRSEEPSPFTF